MEEVGLQWLLTWCRTCSSGSWLHVQSWFKDNKIFSSYQPCQLVTNSWCFRDHLCPYYLGLMWHKIQTLPPLYQPVAHDRNWVQVNGVLVGGVISCLSWSCFWIDLSWCCFIILVTGYQDQMRVKHPSLLKFLGWSLMSIASSIKRPT
jgi:hypothetical protein